MDELKGIVIETELGGFINGLNGEPLRLIRGLSHNRLKITEGRRDIIVIAIELDEDRSACGQGHIAIRGHADGVATGQ